MNKPLPVWALPPIALVVALAIVFFPFRWLWEQLRRA